MLVGGLATDSSSLIYMAKADAFETVATFVDELIAPPAVWREAVETGERKGFRDAAAIREAERRGWLRRIELGDDDRRVAGDLATRYRLGQGESEVLVAAQTSAGALVDETRATRIAEHLGIRAVATIYLPLLGRKLGALDLVESRELLHRIASVATLGASSLLAIEQELERSL